MKTGIANKLVSRLEQNKEVFVKMLEGLGEEEYLWKPNPEKWCGLEVICHLYDEEQYDFRARTKHILEQKTGSFKPIDPPAWVQEHRYMDQDFYAMCQKFYEERERSVGWLQSLDNPDWDLNYTHPVFGKMTAGMFLSNWVAHDYMHVRQILRLKYGYLQEITGEDLSYAGTF